MSELVYRRVKTFEGSIRPPSDKSLTHRALMFASMAEGVHPQSGLPESIIEWPLMGEDCECTRTILRTLGKPSRVGDDGEIRIDSRQEFSGESVVLDCGNSGTTMRLMSGLLAGLPGVSASLVGDHSLSKRPMGRVVEPLRLMGAQIDGEVAPLSVVGTSLRGIDYKSPVASAQIKSAILIAGLSAEGKTTVHEPSKSRDHTERMFQALGVDLKVEGNSVSLNGGARWSPFSFSVPGDISSAAFFMVAAALREGSRVCLSGVGLNPSRTGILDVFEQVGVNVRVDPRGDQLGEPQGDIHVCHAKLRPFEISGDLVPRLIDEIPVLAVLATQCEGRSVIRDAKELRVKETDRIVVVADALTRMGAKVEVFEDGMAVTGPTPLTGTVVDSAGDHRIGMSFAIAGSIADGVTTILNADSIKTSYPTFTEHYEFLTSHSD